MDSYAGALQNELATRGGREVSGTALSSIVVPTGITVFAYDWNHHGRLMQSYLSPVLAQPIEGPRHRRLEAGPSPTDHAASHTVLLGGAGETSEWCMNKIITGHRLAKGSDRVSVYCRHVVAQRGEAAFSEKGTRSTYPHGGSQSACRDFSISCQFQAEPYPLESTQRAFVTQSPWKISTTAHTISLRGMQVSEKSFVHIRHGPHGGSQSACREI